MSSCFDCMFTASYELFAQYLWKSKCEWEFFQSGKHRFQLWPNFHHTIKKNYVLTCPKCRFLSFIVRHFQARFQTVSLNSYMIMHSTLTLSIHTLVFFIFNLSHATYYGCMFHGEKTKIEQSKRRMGMKWMIDTFTAYIEESPFDEF